MKNFYLFLITGFVTIAISGYSQTKSQIDSLHIIAEREARIYLIKKTEAIEWAKRNGYPVKTEIDGSFLEIQYIDENGRPQYYKTDNSNAAATISTNKVYSGGGAGLSLTGSGITVREWDAGSVLSTHQEFDTRVTVVDAVATHYHSTHVAGTIMASGVVANAKGMAYQASLRSFDWNSDVSEMASEGAAGTLISNHSYGYTRGWYGDTWYGDPGISVLEDYLFGFYDSNTQQWDQVALNAPYFLICKSAGNDRGNSGSGPYPPDGPYDCIGQQGVAKNIMTVGAVDDIPGGYTSPSDVVQTNCYWSSWGPADDGRIKPDIVANGSSLYSTYNTNNTSYASLSGTSMATPSVAGSLALLQQHYYTLKGSYMRAATIKALVIHTADEAGSNTGPDYNFGWGLMNTKNAALKISADQTTDVISELTLNNGVTYTRDVIALGTEPLKVTIVWTDPPGTPPAASLDPITAMLVNDLDLRITRSGNTYYPWKLDRDNPTNVATNVAENNVDNVEVVYIASPVAGSTYTITVDHDGTLSGGAQAYSMIISGIASTVPPVADFIASNTNPSINTQVNFTDISSNIPTSWSWSFSPSTITYLNGTSSTSQNPQVQFTALGFYTVTLTATNAYGSDAETKTNYINVINCTFSTLPFTESFSGTTIPTCWTQVDNQSNGQIWQFGTITAYSPYNPSLTGNYAYLNSDAYGSSSSQNVDLITPTLNLSAYSTVTLQFNHYFRAYSGSSGKLSFSTNNGSSWTLITTFTSTTNPAAYSQAISAVAGQSQVKFKWNYTGSYGWYWAFDDVQITGTCSSTLPVSVSIGASANPVCTGTSVTFTATPTNGGTTPSYQWKVNGINAGTNNSIYSYAPINNDAVTCVLTSSASCVTGNPATSNTVTMAVNPILPVSVTIAPSANPVCAGDSVTFTPTPVNGGTPTYQWYKNAVAAGTGSTYSFVPVSGDQVYVVMTSGLTCKSGSPATSNTVIMTVNPNLPVSVSITPLVNPVCAGTSVTFTAAPVNGGTTPVYQWKVNGINAGTNSNSYTYAPVNNDAVTCVLTSNATCATGSPATSNTVTMTVNPNLPVSVSITPSANPVCAGTSVTFTPIPVNGGSPTFQWFRNSIAVGTGSTYSCIPVDGDQVYAVMTSGLTCKSGSPATSNTITMIVSPNLPVSVSITPSANPVCAGTSVTFTPIPVNGGTPTYQWFRSSIAVGTGTTYSCIPVDGDQIYAVMTSSLTCKSGSPATSNTIIMTVNPNLPVSVSISPSANPVCAGTSVTFTPTPVNGGTPTYQWFKNSIAVSTGSAYSCIPVDGDQVYAVMTSSLTCKSGSPATSNTVIMTVNPNLAVSVSIAPSENPVCAGISVTFTPTPVNGGTPTYQWFKNSIAVGTGSAYSCIPVDGDQVYTVMTSGLSCKSGSPATSNTVIMTVNTNLPVSVSISPSINPVCAGTSVTFTPTPVNGGTPTYQWFRNSIAVGTGSTYSCIPVDGDQVYVIMTSGLTCQSGNPATSNAVIMTVNPNLPVSVSIAPSVNLVCDGTSVTYTATPINGGTTPVYQWKVNGISAGTNSPSYSYIPADNDQITCVMTSDAVCATGNPATSNAVIMTVNPNLPVSVSIAPSVNLVCDGNSVTYTATPVNGGTNPVYQWKVNGINAGTNSPSYSYIPADNDQITCVMTSDAVCATGNPATSNAVIMTVNPNLPVSVSIAPSANLVCDGNSVTFTATPVNGGTNPVYQWKVNGINAGTNSPSYSYIPADNDQITCVMTSDAVCATGNPATSNAVIMTVNPNLPVSVSIAPSVNLVCDGTSVTYTATPVNGGTNPVYQWKVNGINAGTNSPSYSYIPADNDQITCVMTSDAVCATGNPATSNAVIMTVNPNLPVSVSIAPSANLVCDGNSVTFTATPVNGGINPVYQWKVNGISAGTNSPSYSYIPADNDQVTCVLTSDATCATGSPATSNTVIMTVNPNLPVSVSVAPSENPVLAGTVVTFTATPTNGGSTPVYQWKVNGTNAGINSPTYSYVPEDNDQVTCVLTSDAVCTTGNPATSNTVTMTVTPLTLFVDPSNRGVTASAGMTTFNVTSNTGWTVISDQAWCTVDPSGSGNGSITATYAENLSTLSRVANITVTVAGLPPVTVTVTQAGAQNKVLNLKVYLEGLYNGAGAMRQAYDETGPHFGTGIADHITVELHYATSPFNFAYIYTDVSLNTDGTLSVSTIPLTETGSYFIVIKNRNHIETWSAAPVALSGAGPFVYDFSTTASQAYGSNMKQMGTVYAVWAGDVTQDGHVDGSDMAAVDNASTSILKGYIAEDANGDGLVDGSDMGIIDNNSTAIVHVQKP